MDTKNYRGYSRIMIGQKFKWRDKEYVVLGGQN